MSTKEKKGGLFRKKFGGAKKEGEGAAPPKKPADPSKAKSKKPEEGEMDDNSSKSSRTSRGRAREDQAPASPAKGGKLKKDDRGRDGKETKPSQLYLPLTSEEKGTQRRCLLRQVLN